MRGLQVLFVAAAAVAVFGYDTRHEDRRGGKQRRIEIRTEIVPRSPSRSNYSSSVKGRDSLRPEHVPTFEANRHYNEMITRTRCRSPRPVVIDVQKFYPNSAVGYLPHCTILHRCDSEAGCCGSGRVCRARSKEPVHVFFYTTSENPMDPSSVVKLTFTNHTQCECEEDLEDNQVEATTEEATKRKKISLQETADDVQDLDDYDDDEESCKRCPKPFSIRKLDSGICSCDCFDKDTACLKIKRGSKRLEESQSRCVLREECNAPLCITGDFDKRFGRCPKHDRSLRHRRRHEKGHFNL